MRHELFNTPSRSDLLSRRCYRQAHEKHAERSHSDDGTQKRECLAEQILSISDARLISSTIDDRCACQGYRTTDFRSWGQAATHATCELRHEWTIEPGDRLGVAIRQGGDLRGRFDCDSKDAPENLIARSFGIRLLVCGLQHSHEPRCEIRALCHTVSLD